MPASSSAPLTGVFPVLPTPFKPDGSPDVASLRNLARYLLAAGVDGITYPGVASEVGQLTREERQALLGVVLEEVAGRCPVIAGVSHPDLVVSAELAADAARAGASALMVAAPVDRKDVEGQVAYFRGMAEAAGSTPIMLQNVPPPAGAGLDPAVLLQVLRAVPAIRYVKEEALPSGQRLTALREARLPSLQGVFGGAGGRYITDEIRRGAAGTMPAIELAEVHVALWSAHRHGDADAVRRIFTRMLPILNVQAVFRWALTKYVLQSRGLIAHNGQRAAGPSLDGFDRAEVDSFLADVADLLLPASRLPRLG
ncbi:dihydrodipicolinate synthase family protein [Ramlibacter sp. G-1-2-2]|uniref:Dihydrodipicolinate synthase family protein n=1 Tax=Ramlibacter agri TaxID=2728837 RepID=A0A848HCX6_9BURK|nr:dihydrodipicolinate synthase family protein [Ramlibacter agri]NML47231.1 dihydrodipicolinate synthase family protein [Ramlibacter agri]